MIHYILKLNNGSELLGTTGKSITADKRNIPYVARRENQGGSSQGGNQGGSDPDDGTLG